jgi:hypothetical protein
LQGKSELKEPPFPVITKTQGTCGFPERTSKELCISDNSFIIILFWGENGSYTLPFSPKNGRTASLIF